MCNFVHISHKDVVAASSSLSFTVVKFWFIEMPFLLPEKGATVTPPKGRNNQIDVCFLSQNFTGMRNILQDPVCVRAWTQATVLTALHNR